MTEVVYSKLVEWFSKPDINVVAIDADDTIWYDSRYFLRIKQTLFQLARACGVEDKYTSEKLAAHEARNLSGEAGYAASILETAKDLGLRPDAFSDLQIEVQNFLTHPLELLPFVSESLHLLKRYQLILITRGHRIELERKLSQARVSEFFSTVFILPKKTDSEMKRVFDHLQTECEHTMVIGNSIRHDVIPATQNERKLHHLKVVVSS